LVTEAIVEDAGLALAVMSAMKVYVAA